MAQKTAEQSRLTIKGQHGRNGVVYLKSDAVVRKDPDGRTIIGVAGGNLAVEAPGLRDKMKVGLKGGAQEQEFLAVNFVKVAELLGFAVDKADRPQEAATRVEEITEPDPKK